MNIELPELSKRLLAAGGAALIGLGALSACGGEGDTGSEGGADTETAAEDGGEEAEAAAGDGTSAEAPLPAGSAVVVGDWTVTGEVVLDATEDIMAANEFNTEPAEGSQQALVTLDGTYDGDATGTLWLDVTFGIWADGTFYDSVDCLNVVEDGVIDAPEVSPGGTAAGASCVEIPTGADTYLLYFEDLFSFDGTQYFVAIA